MTPAPQTKIETLTQQIEPLRRAVEAYDRAKSLYQWMLQLKRQGTTPKQADVASP